MSVGTDRFGRADRLLRSDDFKRVLKSGERLGSPCFTIFIATRSLEAQVVKKPGLKLGITVSRRVGNAVTRNRIKRRVREWFRQARRSLPGEKDIVVIAHPAARELAGPAMVAMLDQLAHRLDAAGIEQLVAGSR